MGIRKLVIVATLLFATAKPARAEFGIGFFLGQPTGLDIKVDIARKSALDFVIGWHSHFDRFDNGGYFHATYLYQPFIAHGDRVAVPFRIGIGIAIYDDTDRWYNDDINVAVRMPFEVGFRFIGTPVEIYLEIALKITFIDPDPRLRSVVDLDGGIGVRFMF